MSYELENYYGLILIEAVHGQVFIRLIQRWKSCNMSYWDDSFKVKEDCLYLFEVVRVHVQKVQPMNVWWNVLNIAGGVMMYKA